MEFSVSLTGPPNRESLVAELRFPDSIGASQPAEIYVARGVRMIAIYPRERTKHNTPWEFPLHEFLQAVNEGVTALDAYGQPSWRASRSRIAVRE